MSDTTFIHRQTPIQADWLNDVNDVTYGIPNNSDPSKGAGMVGYSPAVSYSDGLGKFLNYTFGRTASEIAASVTPTNYAYPPGDVRRYGATGDGVTNDSSAISSALAAAANGGGFVEFHAGTFKLSPSFSVPAGVVLRGKGKGVTVLKRAASGDFISSMASFAGLRDLTIDGDTATVGAGRGVLIPAGNPGQMFFNAEIKNFSTACLEFAANGGSGFRSIACDYYTTGTVGSVAAIKVNGTDPSACPRHFWATEGGGCTLYDFGGANDQFIYGGYTAGMIFGSASSKVMMNAVRIAPPSGSVTISGGSHKIKGCVFAAPVILDASTSGVEIDSEVPGWSVTDNGTGNFVTLGGTAPYSPTWTASTTNPSIGNGSIQGYLTRRGNRYSVTINITAGSTTTFGSGTYYFSLPRADASSVTQSGVGVCFAQNGSGSSAALGSILVRPGTTTVQANIVSGGAANALGSGSVTWDSSSIIRMSFEYQTI